MLISLTRREILTLRQALAAAIEDREHLIECYRVTWSKRGHRKIVHKSNKPWTDAAARKIAAYRKLGAKLARASGGDK